MRDEEGDGNYEFCAHAGHGELDAVLMASLDHYVLCWTYPVRGRREVIGVEVRPKQRGWPGKQELVDLQTSWMLPSLEDFEVPPDPKPVSAVVLRGLPLRQVMEARAEAASASLAADRHDYTLILYGADVDVGLTKEELDALPYLVDAASYVTAADRGDRAPARSIAEARGVSHRTAQGRVARARELGLLTPADRGQAGGELTEKAQHLAHRARIVADELRKWEGSDSGKRD